MSTALKHPVFKRKDILVLVAHPDDECLYFYGGLKELAKNSHVTVLSATYSRSSFRAKELKSACLALGIDCAFLEIGDLGFQSLLPNLEQRFNNFMANKAFDMIITHPPHGGEKPHPHHLQLFLMSLTFSLKNQFKFGFFSENSMSFCEESRRKRILKLRILPVLFLYSVKTFHLLNWKYKWQWFGLIGKQLVTLSLRSIFWSVLFRRYEIETSVTEKQNILRGYFSQKLVLEKYKSLSSGNEYLFFMISFDGDIQGIENLTFEYPFENYDGTKKIGGSWIGIS